MAEWKRANRDRDEGVPAPMRRILVFNGDPTPSSGCPKPIQCVKTASTSCERRTRTAGSFPQCGKLFSTVWKSWAVFSIEWKILRNFFHTVETIFPWCGKTVRQKVLTQEAQRAQSGEGDGFGAGFGRGRRGILRTSECGCMAFQGNLNNREEIEPTAI